MSVQSIVEQKLADEFEPFLMEVINESHQHNVPAGSESHFKVVLVTSAFNDMRMVARHQLVYRELAQEMADQIHALSLHTYTQDEWLESQQAAPDSPQCRGGSK